MRFAWDDAKNAENLQHHRISFEVAVRIFDGLTLERWDGREEYGEDRWIAVGLVDNRTVAVVYTERGDVIRPISARKATTDERKAYEDYLAGC